MLAELLDAWLSEYPNAHTRKRYRMSVRTIATATGAQRPEDLSAAAISQWLTTYTAANNTIRGHIAAVRGFLQWCHETGVTHTYRDRPIRRLLASYPATYGKVQGKRPANRLDAVQYASLLAACQDGTDGGLRDELIIRLAVTGGMRSHEVLTFTVGGLRRAPDLAWTGKRNKPRTARAGARLCELIADYLARYEAALGRPLDDADPIACRAVHPKHPGTLAWGQAITADYSLQKLLTRRTTLAGVGYMGLHDLKRTAARIMHESRSADGGHHFDLLDIADVLDHSNPKVTKDCYIGPLSNDNKRRAADLFD